MGSMTRHHNSTVQCGRNPATKHCGLQLTWQVATHAGIHPMPSTIRLLLGLLLGIPLPLDTIGLPNSIPLDYHWITIGYHWFIFVLNDPGTQQPRCHGWCHTIVLEAPTATGPQGAASVTCRRMRTRTTQIPGTLIPVRCTHVYVWMFIELCFFMVLSLYLCTDKCHNMQSM